MNDAESPPRSPFPSWKITGSQLGLFLPCLAVAIAVAFVPLGGLRALGAPLWLAVSAAVIIFPILPLLWHILAERRYGGPGVTPTAVIVRLSLRILAIALFALATALSTLGPLRLRDSLARLVRSSDTGQRPAPPPPPRAPAPGAPAIARDDLESFIPADANLVVSLAGSAAMQQVLSAHGVDTRDKLAAFAKCKIETEHARVLIAARAGGPKMVVVRAPGIADERNLYCLIGVMGNDRLQIRFLGKEALRFEVKGLLARPLIFQGVDGDTISATDESWRDSARKLFPEGTDSPEGRLAAVLARVDRTASLWSASVADTAAGSWDLALDARVEGTDFKLRGSSIPPAGEPDRAEIAVRVPLAFASALPEGALAEGVRGVVSAVVATGASLPSARRPDGGHR